MSATLEPSLHPSPTTAAEPSTDADDVALLVGIRHGDLAAADALYRRHVQQVRRYASSFVHGAALDDVVSETFARTLRALRNGAGPQDQPIRYLYVTARTVAIGYRTRERRRQEADERFSVGGQATAPVDDKAILAVHEAFPRLPWRWQAVLWMTEVEGRPASQVGEVLGLGPGAVHSLASRARRGLREAYAEAHARLDD